jgi:hypothetical protein
MELYFHSPKLVHGLTLNFITKSKFTFTLPCYKNTLILYAFLMGKDNASQATV